MYCPVYAHLSAAYDALRELHFAAFNAMIEASERPWDEFVQEPYVTAARRPVAPAFGRAFSAGCSAPVLNYPT